MAKSLGKLEKGDMNKLERMIGTGQKTFTLLYSATRDGCSASTFHLKCDVQGPTVTVVFNTEGSVFGGYTAESWYCALNNYSKDPNAFLYQLKFSGNDQPTKFSVVNSENAIYSHYKYGPTFGGYSLFTFSGDIDPSSTGVFALNGYVKFNDKFYQMSNVLSDVKSAADINNGNMNVTDFEVYKVTDSGCVQREATIAWRKTGTMDEKALKRLKEEIEVLRPPSDDVENFRLLLVGPVGSGKTSFCNTIASVFRGRITQRAIAGEGAHSLTAEYNPIPVRGSKGTNLHLLLCDTPGIGEETGLEQVELNYLLGGHVPDFHQFNPVAPLDVDDPGFVMAPRPANKIHCLVLVVDASKDLSPSLVARLKAVITLSIRKKIPQVVLLTKVDKLDDKISADVSTVFKNTQVAEFVLKMSKLLGIPENQIHPVKCYNHEIVSDERIDVLALMALRQILYSAEDHLDNAKIREAISVTCVGNTDNVQGRRRMDVESASEAI